MEFSVLGVTTRHCLPFLFFSPLFFFVYSISWHSPWSPHNAWWRGINVGSGSLQQPEGLFLFHALGTLVSLWMLSLWLALWRQLVLRGDLVVSWLPLHVWRECEQFAGSQSGRPQPMTSASHDGDLGQPQTVSPCCYFFFFFLVFKEREESLGKEQKMPAFSGELLNALHCNTTTTTKNVIDVL